MGIVTSEDANKVRVREAFRSWEQGDSGPFFGIIADNVTWTVIGTTPVSGVYRSKQALIDGAFNPLHARLERPLEVQFVDVAADGDRVFLRFQSTGVTKNAVHYDQVYCLAMLVRDGVIVEIVAYLDTELLAKVFS